MEHNPQEAIEALEQRSKQLTISVAQKEQHNLQAFQKQILQELKTLRATLVKESNTQQAPQAANDEEKDKKI
jgi:gamma-glutamylcysteine synthetase